MAKSINFQLNGRPVSTEADPSMPLLWFIRDRQGLTGTKFGCGIAQCGACTVLIDGSATRSCGTLIGALNGKSVVTIEGITKDELTPLQRAWCQLNVPQCGYCQSGQIMSATSLLAKTPHPTNDQIDQAMSGNICRCGTYPRIRRAIRAVADGEIK
jgi:isoquinoline 1-oxidoreductase subunit alpha